MGHGRADEAGPSLARDVEEASAGNGPAQSSVPTFLEQRKFKTAEAQQASNEVETSLAPICFTMQTSCEFVCNSLTLLDFYHVRLRLILWYFVQISHEQCN